MLSGTLDDFEVTYVFRLVSFAQKTGKLNVGGPAGSGKVYFQSGKIYHAESDTVREGFGRKLLNAGKLTEAELRSTVERAASTGKGLGEALIDGGLVTRSDLEAVLRQEIQEVVFGLLRNDSGRFSFVTDERVESDSVVLVHVESLISGDLSALERRVPSLNPVFVKASISAGDEMEISITAEEWSVIAHIDGRRSVAEIASRLGRETDSVVRTLQRVLTVGLVTLSEGRDRGPGNGARAKAPQAGTVPRPPGVPPPPPPPIIDLRDEERLWIHESR